MSTTVFFARQLATASPMLGLGTEFEKRRIEKARGETEVAQAGSKYRLFFRCFWPKKKREQNTRGGKSRSDWIQTPFFFPFFYDLFGAWVTSRTAIENRHIFFFFCGLGTMKPPPDGLLSALEDGLASAVEEAVSFIAVAWS